MAERLKQVALPPLLPPTRQDADLCVRACSSVTRVGGWARPLGCHLIWNHGELLAWDATCERVWIHSHVCVDVKQRSYQPGTKKDYF